MGLNAFADAFNKASNNEGLIISMEEYEAKELGVTLETFQMWKKGFSDTYSVVTETFELGYVLPVMRRRNSLKGLRY